MLASTIPCSYMAYLAERVWHHSQSSHTWRPLGICKFNRAPGTKGTVVAPCTEESSDRDQPGTGQCRSAQACKAADNASTPSADQVGTGLLVGPRQGSHVGHVLYGLFRVLPTEGITAGSRDNI